MFNFATPDTVLGTTLLIGALNLLTPFFSKEDSSARTALMLLVSIAFMLNVFLIDWLFLTGLEANIPLFGVAAFQLELNLEPLGLIFLTLIGVLWSLALMYTIKFLAVNEVEHSSRFLFFVNACILCGALIALSANLFTMFVGYEMLTICTIPLIAHTGSKKAIQGLLSYLKILMISGLVLFLPAVIIIYSLVGHGDFVLGGIVEGHIDDTYSIILLLMFVFGITKAAIFPLHIWLPHAMVASYPVSALLHAVVVVKTGLFCIYKVILYVFGLSYLQYLFADYNWLVLFPIATIIYSSTQALRYNKIKMVLAYSTINQLSIALLSASLLTPRGIMAAVLHMVSHSFTKICIFYAAGNIYSVKNSYRVEELIGTRQTMPITSFIILISGLSLMGMPPFAGFISKFYIMLAAADQENILVMIVIAASTLFSAIYMIKMLIFIYRPASNDAILNLKLKSKFNQPVDLDHKRRSINQKYHLESGIPVMMIMSLFLCLAGVVFFIFISRMINQFLVFI